MILVDTSVLIDYLRRRRGAHVEKFDYVLQNSLPYGITSQVYQELLQGTRTRHDFDTLGSYLASVPLYEPLDSRESYASAARIFFDCRKAGITVRSSIDCLIAQICIEHKLQLLHHDRDFDNIRRVASALKFF